jgi:hypothetical protein
VVSFSELELAALLVAIFLFGALAGLAAAAVAAAALDDRAPRGDVGEIRGVTIGPDGLRLHRHPL